MQDYVNREQPPGRITGWDVVPHSLLSDEPHLLLADTVYDERRHTYMLREIAVLDDGTVEIQQTTGRLIRPQSLYIGPAPDLVA